MNKYIKQIKVDLTALSNIGDWKTYSVEEYECHVAEHLAYVKSRLEDIKKQYPII